MMSTGMAPVNEHASGQGTRDHCLYYVLCDEQVQNQPQYPEAQRLPNPLVEKGQPGQMR